MLHMQLLEHGQYFLSDWPNWGMRYIKAASEHSNLTQRVESLKGEEGLPRSLCESLLYISGSLCSW